MLAGSTIIVGLFLIVILVELFSKGLPVISMKFIFGFPSEGMTKGGIFPAIAGTVLVTLLTTVFAVPFGVACAIYLSEYATNSPQPEGPIRAVILFFGMPMLISFSTCFSLKYRLSLSVDNFRSVIIFSALIPDIKGQNI